MKNQGAWVFIKFTLIHENRKKYHRFFFLLLLLIIDFSSQLLMIKFQLTMELCIQSSQARVISCIIYIYIYVSSLNINEYPLNSHSLTLKAPSYMQITSSFTLTLDLIKHILHLGHYTLDLAKGREEKILSLFSSSIDEHSKRF